MIARVDRRALSHHTRTEYVTEARIATLPHQPEVPIEQQPVEMGCRGRSLDTCGLRWRNGLSVWLISVREQGERMRSRSQATGDWVQVQWIACLVSLGWTVSLIRSTIRRFFADHKFGNPLSRTRVVCADCENDRPRQCHSTRSPFYPIWTSLKTPVLSP